MPGTDGQRVRRAAADLISCALYRDVPGKLGGAGIPNGLSMRISARSPREHLVAAMGGFNAAADLGFFLGPVAGGILAGWGVKWAFAIAPLVTLLAVIWLAGDR